MRGATPSGHAAITYGAVTKSGKGSIWVQTAISLGLCMSGSKSGPLR